MDIIKDDKALEEAIQSVKSKQQPDGELLCRIGLTYWVGSDKVKLNPPKSLHYFKKALNTPYFWAAPLYIYVLVQTHYVDRAKKIMFAFKVDTAKRRFFLKAVGNKNPIALFCQAYFYMQGLWSINQKTADYQSGIDCCQALIKQKRTAPDVLLGMTYRLLGYIHQKGHAQRKKKKPNYKKALEYYQEAGKRGNINACSDIGLLYLLGHHPLCKNNRPNYAMAATYYHKSARQNSSSALTNLGGLYRKGYHPQCKKGEPDYEKALLYYEKAKALGNMAAVACIAFLYRKGQHPRCQRGEPDYEKALYYYNKSARFGNAVALNGLANLYEQGYGYGPGSENHQPDYQKAAYYYEKAAHLNCREGLNNIGALYATGHHPQCNDNQPDYKKAEYYYEKSASLKCPSALNNLGNLYFTGHHTNCVEGQPDDEKATFYYQKAIRLGGRAPLINIAQLYERGRHPHCFEKKPDYLEAIKHYAWALKLGDPMAFNMIGQIYIKGRHPSCQGQPNYNRAFEYFVRFLKLGQSSEKDFFSIVKLYPIAEDEKNEESTVVMNKTILLYYLLFFAKKKTKFELVRYPKLNQLFITIIGQPLLGKTYSDLIFNYILTHLNQPYPEQVQITLDSYVMRRFRFDIEKSYEKSNPLEERNSFYPFHCHYDTKNLSIGVSNFCAFYHYDIVIHSLENLKKLEQDLAPFLNKKTGWIVTQKNRKMALEARRRIQNEIRYHARQSLHYCYHGHDEDELITDLAGGFSKEKELVKFAVGVLLQTLLDLKNDTLFSSASYYSVRLGYCSYAFDDEKANENEAIFDREKKEEIISSEDEKKGLDDDERLSEQKEHLFFKKNQAFIKENLRHAQRENALETALFEIEKKITTECQLLPQFSSTCSLSLLSTTLSFNWRLSGDWSSIKLNGRLYKIGVVLKKIYHLLKRFKEQYANSIPIAKEELAVIREGVTCYYPSDTLLNCLEVLSSGMVLDELPPPISQSSSGIFPSLFSKK